VKNSKINKLADKIVNAFIKGKIIAPLPNYITKRFHNADKFRKLCESKMKDEVIGFKAAGTGIPMIKKLKEKEPFYASIYKKNFINILFFFLFFIDDKKHVGATFEKLVG